MAVPSGITIAWPGTVASIPGGWDRVVNFDDRYAKGTATAVDPDVTGGATSHTHVSPSHSHSVASHSHAGTTGISDTSDDSGSGETGVLVTHTHTYTSGSVAGSAASSTTWDSETIDPLFFTVIWIESDGTPVGFPDGCLAFYDDTTPPVDWIQHVASKTRFLRGAAAAGDAGSTGGGGSHAHSGVAHTHPFLDHTHPTATSSNASTSTDIAAGSTSTAALIAHTHTVALAGSPNEATGSQTSADTDGTTYEPSFHTLLAVENDLGADDLPIDIIAMWRGLLVNIPAGWVLCDGGSGTPDLRDKFVKCANVGGDVGDTGGADGHDHTDPATHTHSVDHTHEATGGTVSGAVKGAGGNTVSATVHEHVAATSGSGAVTSGGTAQTVNTNSDTQPPFRTVVYIQLQGALTVTIDDPNEDDVETSPGFLIDWSFGGAEVQQDFRVQIFSDAGATNEVYDSGTVVSATTSEQTSRSLLSGQDYYIRVRATDTGQVIGVSALRHITTLWTPPDEITGLTVTLVEDST